MARILGLGNPNVTGKIGNIVYTTYKQGVIAKAYQPKVFNPRSRLQVSQRERFKLANLYVKRAIRDSRLLYGTGRLSFERAALMRSFLKSRLLKNLGGNLSLEKPQLVILPNGENAQLFKTTGKSYEPDKLNVFDWGVTIDFPRNIVVDKFETTWNYQTVNVAWLIDGQLNYKYLPDSSQYYFGSDYILPNLISVSQITGVSVESEPNFLSYQFSISKIVESENNFTTGKNRGLFSSLGNCGNGWKYYYVVKGNVFNSMKVSLYPAKAVFNGKVISTVAAACVMVISASTAQISTDGSSLDTVISITAQDILNIEPTFTEPGA